MSTSTIQSASAGGAGRGFAVVADEVQRLAERATNATRRIEMLVQNIQADTSEAAKLGVTGTPAFSMAAAISESGRS